MAQPSTRIPVEHCPVVHNVETSVINVGSAESVKSAKDVPTELTLLELIDAVSEVSDTEQEVIATVSYMLSSGRVRLSGNFRDEPVSRLCG